MLLTEPFPQFPLDRTPHYEHSLWVVRELSIAKSVVALSVGETVQRGTNWEVPLIIAFEQSCRHGSVKKDVMLTAEGKEFSIKSCPMTSLFHFDSISEARKLLLTDWRAIYAWNSSVE